MYAFMLSLVRTYVPLGVGAFLSWLAVNYNVVVPDDASAALGVGLTAILVSVYYGIVRALESRWPFLGKLLGSSQQPTYSRPEPEAVQVLRARSTA